VRIQERVLIPSSQDQVWDFVWQTERLAACLPGCARVETVEPGRVYRAQMVDQIGPFRIEAEMQITIEEVSAPDHIRLRAVGKDNRLGATQRIALDIRLTSTSEKETSLDVTGDVEVLGKVASLGQFAIKRKMNDVVRQFGQNIRAACSQGARAPDA